MKARWLALAGAAVLALPLITTQAGAQVTVIPNPTPGIQHVDIYGADHFIRPGLITNNFNFFPGNITVKHGAELAFVNYTGEGHTIALISAADLPRTTKDVFACSSMGPSGPNTPPTFCSENLGVFFPDPMQNNPSVAQIDVGTIGTQTDARALAVTTDPAVLAGVQSGQFPLLEASFDTPGPGNATDSIIIGQAPGTDGFQGDPYIRTVVINAAPGVYHYICTFHAWMQGTITVTP